LVVATFYYNKLLLFYLYKLKKQLCFCTKKIKFYNKKNQKIMETASTETLFRFTTFRKPEKGTTKEIGKGFIYHPTNGRDGFFAEEIINPKETQQLQMVALVERSKAFNSDNGKLTNDDLNREVGNNFFDYAIWFAANSKDIADKLIVFPNEAMAAQEAISRELEIKIWSNLFYQMITDESVEVRTNLVNILCANNFAKKNIENRDIAYQYADAKIVIPKGLYALKDNDAIGGVNIREEVTRSSPHFAFNNDFKILKSNLAVKDTVQQINLLETELQKIKSKYNKAYKLENDKAIANHNVAINQAYADATFTIDTVSKRRVYENLVLPIFNFTFDEVEISQEILNNNLSEIALAQANKLGVNEVANFRDAFELIDEYKNTLTEQPILTFTAQKNINTTVIGGTVINSVERKLISTESTKLDYSVEGITVINYPARGAAHFKLRFYVNTGDANLNISSCTITNDLEPKTTTYFKDITVAEVGSGSIIKVFEVFLPKPPATATGSYIFIDETVSILFTGKIKLTDNKFWKFSFPMEFEKDDIDVITPHIYANDYEGQMIVDSETIEPVGGDAVACLPNITSADITMLIDASNKAVYTFNFNWPVVNTTILKIFIDHKPKGTLGWRVDNNGTTDMKAPYKISLNNTGTVYDFRLRVSADGSCNEKTSEILNYQPIVASGDPALGSIPTFTPSQYGVKSLGIAEFRRVEQTLCCYEPGEVSTIENVMQGEFREKGSRKLHRTEITNTTETSTEKESLSDTITTERFSMQSQVASVVSQSINANAHVEYSGPMVSAGAAFGFNSSKQESNSHAVNYGKDVTTRALERVVQKVRGERVVKTTDEFEETNKHGYDNRGGNGHISGIYRFIDKVYNNQIFNYGKRLLYEFVIPEPSKFHNEAIKSVSSVASNSFMKPVDPRTSNIYQLNTYQDLNTTIHTDALASVSYWASKLNVKVDSIGSKVLSTGISKQMMLGSNEALETLDLSLDIPKGYQSDSISYSFFCLGDKDFGGRDGGRFHNVSLVCGEYNLSRDFGNDPSSRNFGETVIMKGIEGKFPIIISGINYLEYSLSIKLNLTPTYEASQNWQIDTFNKIITAYEDKLREYNDAVNTAKSMSEQKATNPLFYRQIENICLKKNCMDYITPNKYLGQGFYTGNGIENVKINPTAIMEEYANRCRFLEEAFDWGIMSYKFYPFYWGKSDNWASMYKIESDDPLFANFMQAGMGRVIVPVRPGFEAAVMFYMTTGKVWNGTDKILLDLDLHKTVAFEMENQSYKIEKTWKTKVPSSLTMIQKGNTGLNLEGLPCSCKPLDENNFTKNDIILPHLVK
jgi:hypothetical protein